MDDFGGPQGALGEPSAEVFWHFEASLAAMGDLGFISSLQKLFLADFWFRFEGQNRDFCSSIQVDRGLHIAPLNSLS